MTGLSITHKTDYTAEALADLLLSQYGSSAFLRAILVAITDQVQLLEDDVFAVVTQRVATAAVGVQLDIIGAMVGQERGGRDDVDYLEWIEARILANASRGTPNEVLTVAACIVDIPVIYRRQGIACFSLLWIINGPAPSTVQTDSLFGIIEDASPAGVAIQITQTYTLPGPAFQFDTAGAGLTAGVFQTSRVDVL